MLRPVALEIAPNDSVSAFADGIGGWGDVGWVSGWAGVLLCK